jgi:gliding motility-associated-like protein
MNVEHIFSYATPIKLYYQDITSLINTASTNNTITILPPTSTHINWGYWSFFIYVIYENPTLPTTSYTILINDKKLIGNEIYVVNNLMPINISNPVSFSLYQDRSGAITPETLAPNTYVYFNNQLLGTVGGSDNVNQLWNVAGVKGHFYYQNNQLFGLDDDTPDAVMNGTDGLADVSSYVANNATSCSFRMTNIEFPNQLIHHTCPNLAYFLTYTTTCPEINDIVSSDTTICQGEQIQLHASGGTKYEWKCLTDTAAYGNSVYGLSCKDCANPVFSGDNSAVYTVRIWNTDSCSVVRPVRVKVLPTPQFTSISVLPTACGFSNGKLAVTSTSATDSLLVNNLVVGKLPVNLANLGAGQYTLSIKDAKGCFSQDTVVVLPALPSVHAFFSLNPQQGAAPLTVHSNNQSTGANLYEWQFQNTNSTQTEPVFTFDTAGTYIVTLIANNNTPACADTFSLSVWVYDSLQVHIPNIITPNNDGTNDWFSIQVNAPITGSVSILNRWGNTVYSSDVKANNKGTIQLWDGKTNQQEVVEGTYYYRFQLTDLQGKELEMHGFVEVVR